MRLRATKKWIVSRVGVDIHGNIDRLKETLSGKKLKKNYYFEISTLASEQYLCKSFFLSYWAEFEHYMWEFAIIIIFY